MRHINIRSRKIRADQGVFIIAEAGVNHNGTLKLAKKMVDIAKDSGADAVKFQTFKTEDLVVQNRMRRAQFEMLKRFELTEKDFGILNDYCKKKRIMFLSTPFDSKSAQFLYKLRIPIFKIASGELTNVPLLRQIALYNKPIILSTGMSTLKEVKEAVDVIYATGNKKLILLHCTSNYPAKYEDVNLKAMDALKKEFNVVVGYSDHTQGIEVSVAAVAMGARVIEKHFTLDRTLPGPDHKASLEPDELKRLVSAIRNIERAMGDGAKMPRYSENKIKKIVRKSIVVACDISKGTSFTMEMLAIKRPGTGIEPFELEKIVNKKAKNDIRKDQVLSWKDIK